VTGRVLIVEPDVLTCWSLATYLGRWYAVDTARSGAAAVRRLRAQPADAVIISDQIRGSAAEAIASAARGGRPNVRLVLLTTDDADTRLARVAVERVEKPFALPELARVLGVAGSES
jgi:DNA-binding response OmpR family regulator